MKQYEQKNGFTIEQEARKAEAMKLAIVTRMQAASGKSEEYCKTAFALLNAKEAKAQAEQEASKKEIAFTFARKEYEKAQEEAQAANIENAIAKYASRKSKSASIENQIELYSARKAAQAEQEAKAEYMEAAFGSVKNTLAEYKAAFELIEKNSRAEKIALYGFLFACAFECKKSGKAFNAEAEQEAMQAAQAARKAEQEAQAARSKKAETRKAAFDIEAMIEAQEAENKKAASRKPQAASRKRKIRISKKARKAAQAKAKATFEMHKRIISEKGKANYIKFSDIKPLLEGKKASAFCELTEKQLLDCLQYFYNFYAHNFTRGNLKKKEVQAAKEAQEAYKKAIAEGKPESETSALYDKCFAKIHNYKENVSVFLRFAIEYEQDIKNHCVMRLLEKYVNADISLFAAFAASMKNAFGRIFDFAFSQSKFSAIAYNEIIECGKDISDIEAEEKLSLIELQAAIENCLEEYARSGKRQAQAASRLHDVYLFYGMIGSTQEEIASMLKTSREQIKRDIHTLRVLCENILASR